MKSHATVAVLGAGLQGCAVAFELARRGLTVELIEQDVLAMNRASLRNEAKIHLGLIYAQDKTLRTARLQLRGALCFRALLERWCGPDANILPIATPFRYLVAGDSIMTPEALEAHYAALEDECRRQLARDPGLDYLGTRPDRLARRLAMDELAGHFRAERFLAGFDTAELALDADDLAALVRRTVERTDAIAFLPGRRVRSVERTDGGFLVSGESADGPWQREAARVVNATWENRLAIDGTVGLTHRPGWLHRLKYRVIVALPQAMRGAPSATMVIGRYGDVVVRPNGTAYLSWYPIGLRGWTHELAPPEDWEPACRGDLALQDEADFAAGVVTAIAEWYPGMAGAVPIQVDAGAIFAYGRTDVDDAGSDLHLRSLIGITGGDGYWSIDPGKLTTAPLFAMIAADRILGTETEWAHADALLAEPA